MNKVIPVLLGLAIASAGSAFTAAQQSQAPPKVLTLAREFLKPGKAGDIHDRSESRFVAAMAAAKWPTRYVALNSLSGKTRALYLTGYDSFDAWQKDTDATMKNTAFASTLDRIEASDGDLLSDFDQAVLYYEPDQSLRSSGDLTNIRYLEFSVFKIKPGHNKEWDEVVKMVIAAHLKANDSANWGTYSLAYGGSGDEYIFISGDKTLADIDTGFAENKKFVEAMGEDGMKKLGELAAACIDSSDNELFSINPKQSYPVDAWVKGNPDFWKPKAGMAMPKPAAAPAKPAPADKK
jgi:hypothetical protein